VGITDETGKQIGRVTAKQVIRALARHTPTPAAVEAA
jgi:glycine betaine/proline transport system ATP-binding protein